MSGSIIKEISCLPHVFKKDFLFSDLRNYYRLLDLLEDISINSYIVAAPKLWVQYINHQINVYDENEKSEIKDILEYLINRHKIVYSSKFNPANNDEEVWINQLKNLNNIREFDVIISTVDTTITKQLGTIDRKLLKNKGADIFKQTKEYLEKVLIPIVSYAEIIKIIDPYFDLFPKSGDKNRYKDSLEIICKNLSNKHGERDKGIIDVHTSIKAFKNQYNEVDFENLEKWSMKIKEFEDNYGHVITLHIWEDLKKEDEWHDRYLITNQCGISVGKGSDISEWTDSTWTIVDWEKISDITSKFELNRALYNHIAEVTSNCIKRDKKPLFSVLKKSKEEKIKEEIALDKKYEDEEKVRLEKINREPKRFGKHKIK